LNDWNGQAPDRPGVRVSKFVPGEHFHVLNEKFLSLDDAIKHLKSKGYEYDGLDEKFVYPEP
jgi:hypothetical protein